MKITRGNSQASRKGPAEYFTGTVRVDLPFSAPPPARVSGGTVTFEPGARTAWHTHPLGQTIIITAGADGCRSRAVQRRKSVPAISSGSRLASDIGTALRRPRGMTHIAIAEALDGKVVDWMEKVSDDQYGK